MTPKLKSAVFAALSLLGTTAFAKAPVDLVNPFVDTHNSRFLFFSSASRPFGMVNVSPDTDPKGSWGSGYLYGSKTIKTFSHIHSWQIAGVAVMPTTGEFKGNKGVEAYQSAFSHEGEIAKPGYHKVFLQDYGITVELTSTMRVGLHRYTFPQSKDSSIIFDLAAELEECRSIHSKFWKVNDHEVAGYEVLGPAMRRPKNTPVYFVARVSRPIEKLTLWREGRIVESAVDSIEGMGASGALRFQTKAGEQVLLKVAISYVSVDQARLNLDTELPGWDFDAVRDDSYAEWNRLLGRIEVAGGTETQQIKFYTDLWHVLLGRRTVSDVDGKYLDMTGDTPRVRQVRLDASGKPLFPQYNFDALWGTHWSLNILWSMAYPEIMDGFCNTMVNMYNDGGLIPRGPAGGNYTFVMIGDPATPFFAAAFNKGIRNFDVEQAYAGLRKNAFPGGIRDHGGYEHVKHAVGGGMTYYVDRGYVPEGIVALGADDLAGASMTLEYSYEDWCLAQIAQALGKTADYELFMQRSQNYHNVWNAAEKQIHPREMDGSWSTDFTPNATIKAERRGFCESNSQIYSHFVPHDMKGLIALYGGNEAYVEQLNRQFERGEKYGFITRKGVPDSAWTDYGQQPGTGMAHLFNHAGAPWLTQKWVRKVKDVFNIITPYGGYDGDEDQGQMGAVGVLMAMGLFSVDGSADAHPYYEITSPIFDRVTIHLNPRYYPGGTFVITTENNSAKNMYIQSAKLNGGVLNSWRFPHAVYAAGGTLDLRLGPEPNKSWGTGDSNGAGATPSPSTSAPGSR